MVPYCDEPERQSGFEKSSVKLVSDERAFVFSLLLAFQFSLVFLLVFVFRLAVRFEFVFEFEFATRLLLSFVILAIAKIKMTSPIPRNTSTAPIPRSHGQTLRFCGATGGIGDQAGGGGGGGGGGAACPEYAIVGGGAVSRPCGY